MNGELFRNAIIRFAAGVLLLGILLFVPAGSLNWPEAWLLMALLFLPMLVAGIVLMVKNPALLARRLNSRESEPAQRQVVALSALMFVAAFVTAGLNKRFGWIVMPRWSELVAAALFLMGFLMYGEVLRENEYLSRTVEVAEGQRVVDTGLYGVVRHPMYAATLLMFLSMPLVLGSPVSLAIMLIYPVLIVRRIRNEEELLKRDLPGYGEYMQKVKYRLIPGIW
jgi:protein-S-isoprenylcysteine O-methyltransferase Ste14